MKLHLGCGERYLDGYLNIDFPPSEHTVQRQTKADRHADILTLAYPPGTVDEVRLHHVFEHFTRPVAGGLVASWASWLKPGGILRIEVPDFARTARAALAILQSTRRRRVALRHLYGSHEAPWAVHAEGYTSASLAALVQGLGFRIVKVARNSWRGTYNIDLTAVRDSSSASREERLAFIRRHLSLFLLDDSPTEARLLETWMEMAGRQLAVGWPPERR